MVSKYIDIVAKCSKDVLKMMANIDTAAVEVKQEKHALTTYAIAHSIKYEDFDNKVSGDFILGFADEFEVIKIASAIAVNLGMKPLEQFNDETLDIINEFLNTAVGHIITEWDKMGMNVRFDPPLVLQKKEMVSSKISDADAYLISINFATDSTISDSTAKDKLAGKRILVVEDSAMMRGYITRALEKIGCETDQACDGQEAVEKYRTFNPDLTIMDLIMPKMGGLDAIVEIQEANPQAKFIVFTSTSRRDEVVTAKSLNVLSYLVKPLKVEELLLRVREAFDQMDESP